uniref:MIF4G domain-containing protein n=1 Tax=Panagrolaimus superbus TaxID=310955 RepID=A0A914Y406_9BILA
MFAAVRNLREKLAKTKYNDLLKVIINESVLNDPEVLPTIIDFIFDKVIEESTFAEFYSNICMELELYVSEQNRDTTNVISLFIAVSQKCQNIFEAELTQFLQSIIKTENQLGEEKDPKKCSYLNKQLDKVIETKKHQMFGIFQIIENFIDILFKNVETSRNELMIELVVELIKNIIPFVKRNEGSFLKCWIDDLCYICNIKRTSSNETKVMLKNLTKIINQKVIEINDAAEEIVTKDDRTSTYIIRKWFEGIDYYEVQQNLQPQQPKSISCSSSVKSYCIHCNQSTTTPETD